MTTLTSDLSELVTWARKKLHESGLTDEDAERLGIAPKTQQAVAALRRFAYAHPGLLIPYFQPDGTRNEFKRLRHQPPEPLDDNGKPMRYGQPRRSPNHIYIPVPLVSGNVEAALRDPGVPKLILEGELKAACAAKFLPEFLPLGTGGVASAFQHKHILPFFDQYGWSSHTFVVAFDADVAVNEDSRRMENRLAAALAERGAHVYIARNYGKDRYRKLDDFIVGHGRERGAGLWRERVLKGKVPWTPAMAEDLPAEINFDAPDPVLDSRVAPIPTKAMYGECKNLCQSLQLPPSLAYPAVLTVAAACTMPSKENRVRPSLYCALIGDVGEAKSAVLNIVKQIARRHIGPRVVPFIPSSDRA